MMDKKAIDEISAAVEAIANKYPHIKLCVIMAQPCAEHNGKHLDLASCGVQDLCELVDAAIMTFTGAAVEPPTKPALN